MQTTIKVILFLTYLSTFLGGFAEGGKPDSAQSADLAASLQAQGKGALAKLETTVSQDAKAAEDAVANKANWGVAKLEKVRNMTTSYADIFFQDEQGGLAAQLPNNTIIQIATLRNDLPKINQAAQSTDVAVKTDSTVYDEIKNSNYWSRLDRDVQINLDIVLAYFKSQSGKLKDILTPEAAADEVESYSRVSAFKNNFAGKYQGSIDNFIQTLKSQIKALFAATITAKEEESLYRLFAVRNIMGAWRLISDTYDKLDPATHFIVEHYRDGRLNNWVGLRPVANDKFYLEAAPSNAITVSSEKFAVDDAPNAHWRLDGSSLANCALLNRGIKGFLSCRDLKDEKNQGTYNALDQDFDFTGYRTEAPSTQWAPRHDKTETFIPTDLPLYNLSHMSESSFNHDALGKLIHLSLHKYFYVFKGFELSWYHVDKVSVNKNKTANAYSRSDEKVRDPGSRPYSFLHFWYLINYYRTAIKKDIAKDQAVTSIKNVIDHLPSELGNNHKNAIKKKRDINYGDKVRLVSAAAMTKIDNLVYDSNNFFLQNDTLWIVKGGHKGKDGFNAQMGAPVKNGDVVRLEHAIDGKNLTAEEIKGDLVVKMAGKSGVGSSEDNFVISMQDEGVQELAAGLAFELKHQNSGFRLAVSNSIPAEDASIVGSLVAQEKSSIKSYFFVDIVRAGVLPVANVAWTGVPFGAQATDRGAKEDLYINIVKKGIGGGIAPNNTLEVNVNIQDKQPMVTGFAKEAVPEFSPGLMLTINPLFNQGVAWITQSFETEGRASASFLVRAGDAGNAQVILGNNLTLDYSYKFVLGANENTETQLIRRDFDSTGRSLDTVVARVAKEDNPLAVLRSGAFAPYWVSCDDNTIMLGVGQEMGENVLLVWHDPNPRTKVSRLGFGCDRESIDITNVKIGKAFKINAPKIVYATAKTSKNISATPFLIKTLTDFDSPLQAGSSPVNVGSSGASSLAGLQPSTVESKPVVATPTPASIGAGASGGTQSASSSSAASSPILPVNMSARERLAATLSGGGASNSQVNNSSINVASLEQSNVAPVVEPAVISATTPVGPVSTSVNSAPVTSVASSVNSVDSNSLYPAGLRLRVPGRGGITFEAKGGQELELILSSAELPNNSAGLTRYILKFYGTQTADDVDRKGLFYLKNMAILINLLKQKFDLQQAEGQEETKKTAALNAINAVQSEVAKTFIDLPVESVAHIKNSFKEIFKNFEEWSGLKDAFATFVTQSINKKLPTLPADSINLAEIKTAINFEIDPESGSQTLVLMTKIFNSLREETSAKKQDPRDELKSPAPRKAPDAIIGLFEAIFANRFFDLEAKPICSLEKIDSKTGLKKVVAKVLEGDLKTKTDFAKIPSNNYRRYWINFTEGRIFVGSGDFGENLFLYCWDKKPEDDFEQISFKSTGAVTIRDFAITAELPITQQFEDEAYEQDYQLFDFKGKAQVILPYKYRLSQEGPSVKFKDELTGKTYYPGKVPQKGAQYYFMLMIKEDGFPELVWSREPENPEKLGKDKAAAIAKAEADTLYQASTYVQGMGAIGGTIGVAASIAYSGAGVGRGKDAASLEADSQFNYKSHDSTVYQDTAKIGSLISSNIPPEAVTNKDNFQKELGIGSNWIGDKEKIALLIPHFRKIISRIVHPHVVSNQSDKTLLFSHLTSIFNTHQTVYSAENAPVDGTFGDLIKLLMAAYNNRYLVDTNNKAEQKIRNDWYAKANALTRMVLKKSPGSKVALEPMYGEYIWLEETFATLGKGSITFDAVGQNDVMIAFASEPVQVRNTSKPFYEVALGAWDNSRAVMRYSSLGKVVAQTTSPKMLCNALIEASAANKSDNKYWISVNNGKIILGKGELDPTKAIGVYDQESKTFIDAAWEPGAIVKSPDANKIAQFQQIINKFSLIENLMNDSITLISTPGVLTASLYSSMLNKFKTILPAEKFSQTLVLVNTPAAMDADPAKQLELYSDHLTDVLIKAKAEFNAYLSASYATEINALKSIGLDLSSFKDLHKTITTAVEPPPEGAINDDYVKKITGHLQALSLQFELALPGILQKYPMFVAKTVGRYAEGKMPFHRQDPYPIRDVKYVGISCWNAPITFSNIVIGSCVEESEVFKANIFAQQRLLNGESLSSILASTP